MIRLYDDGWTFQEISEQLKVPVSLVAEVITSQLKHTA